VTQTILGSNQTKIFGTLEGDLSCFIVASNNIGVNTLLRMTCRAAMQKECIVMFPWFTQMCRNFTSLSTLPVLFSVLR
jgi:hypothetical protein